MQNIIAVCARLCGFVCVSLHVCVFTIHNVLNATCVNCQNPTATTTAAATAALHALLQNCKWSSHMLLLLLLPIRIAIHRNTLNLHRSAHTTIMCHCSGSDDCATATRPHSSGSCLHGSVALWHGFIACVYIYLHERWHGFVFSCIICVLLLPLLYFRFLLFPLQTCHN